MKKAVERAEGSYNLRVIRKTKRLVKRALKELETWEKHLLKMERIRQRDRIGTTAEHQVALENYQKAAEAVALRDAREELVE